MKPDATKTSDQPDLVKALQHHRAGKTHLAERLYNKILSRTPQNGDALNLLGALCFEQGQTAQAIRLLTKAVEVLPNFPSAHCNLGNALFEVGREVEAIQSYRRATGLDPALAEGHSNLGRALCNRREFTAAIESARKAVALTPTVAQVWNNLGACLRAAGQSQEALTAMRSALALAPMRADLHRNLGGLLLELGQCNEASVRFADAIQINPHDVESLRGLGTTLRLLGDMDGSLSHYRAALDLQPNRPDFWNDIGSVFRNLGRFDEASDAFRMAISLNPKFGDAYRNLAACGQIAADDELISRLSMVFDSPESSEEDRISTGFALGKIFDEAERYTEAFATYTKANKLVRDLLVRSGQEFKSAQFQEYVKSIIKHFSGEFFLSLNGNGNPSELPVFIVGMPRSGTTLVEQIVASHPLVFGAGELGEIGSIAERLLSEDGSTDRISAEAARHLSSLKKLSNDAERVTDKMPDNIFHLGTIAALYPQARIIFCEREKRDTVLSCFFQRFSGHQLEFSYDLADCAFRFEETERLGAHWRAVLPLRWIEVRYEELIADLEKESRRLISFLGLEWDRKCLEFHQTARTIRTASSWQVRQRLYSSSVGRWRRYVTPDKATNPMT